MSARDVMILKMMAGTMASGTAMVFFSYGVGLIWRNWGWWHQ